MKSVLLVPIDLYRKHLSKRKGAPCCRYFPSCSNYAYRAINEWGSVIGVLFAAVRLLRCNPLFKGGYDPVPRRKRKTIPKTRISGCKTTVDKTRDKDAVSVALMRSIAPVDPKTGNYVPLLTRMERYLYEDMKG